MNPPFVSYTPPGSSTPHNHTSPIPTLRPPSFSQHPPVSPSATFPEIMHSARLRDCIRYWRAIAVQYGQIPPGLQFWRSHYIFCMALTGSHGWQDVGEEGQQIWRLAYEQAQEIFRDPTSSLLEDFLADTHQVPPMTFPGMGSSSQPSSSRAPATLDPPVLVSGAGPSGRWRGRCDGDSSNRRVQQQLSSINDPRSLAAMGYAVSNAEPPVQDYRQTSSLDGSLPSPHYPHYSFEHGRDGLSQSPFPPGGLSNYSSNVTYPTDLAEQPLGHLAPTLQTGQYMAQYANPPWPAAEVSGYSVPAQFPHPGTIALSPPDGGHYAYNDPMHPGTFSLGSDSDAIGEAGQQSIQTSSFNSWDMLNDWYLLDQEPRAEQLRSPPYPYQPYDPWESQAPQ
ncbi:hypothetical protein JAAARDRAFT_54297 [Jaapia argillacea MUCL 33604]|uniref:Uncharacterized protein n=1 Tax=Jaapia argillacea MUCL 33604 TaxID=933084 RepID=A0A067Q5R1_9AGAM|nr:hypothetical protein JAAARDRAFT_54297 [Jaapia argillacea MUCL 33604]